MLKKLNDKLYISLGLWNGPEGADNRVFVTLKNQDQSTLEPEFELPHIGDGVFSESDKLMPAVQVLFICFRITESDGTTIACDQPYTRQRYDRDFTGEQVESLRPIAATIVGEVGSSNITCDVEDLDSISFEIEDNEESYLIKSSEDLEAEIETNEITGVVQ